MSRPPESLVHRGPRRTLVFAVCRDGRMPARSYLDALDRGYRAGFLAICELLAAGQRLSEGTWHAADSAGLVKRMRKGPHRIYCVERGPMVLLTHGKRKASQKTPANFIREAIRIAAEDRSLFGDTW